MEHIGASVERTVSLARNIESATYEQSVGALQIVNTMKEPGAVVWQSTEMAENLRLSAEQLDQCSARIQADWGRFSLTDPEVQREISAPPAPTDFQVVSA
jgi:methyl-accepting chemotaxis protein